MSLRALLSLLVLTAASTGCAVSADHGDAESDLDEDEAAASTTVFYSVRQDFRKCMSPMCGGVFYKKLNKATTTCIGGGAAEWCYAWNADFSAVPAGASGAEPTIFTGTVKTETVNGGKWGKFVAATAWKAITETAPTEVYGADPRFYLVKDNGIRCITTPCYSLDAKRINLSYKTTLSGLDLTGVGATAEQLDRAIAGLADGVVVFGAIKTVKGKVLSGSQAYVQVKRDPNYCESDADCTLSTFTRTVTKKSECYCPMCPTPTSVATATASKASFDKFCSSTGCPLPPCARPPGPAACIENACRYNVGADL